MKEYKFVKLGFNEREQDILDEYSSAGWTLKSYSDNGTDVIFIFERNK